MCAPVAVLNESFLSDAFAGRGGQTPPFKGWAHAAPALCKTTLFSKEITACFGFRRYASMVCVCVGFYTYIFFGTLNSRTKKTPMLPVSPNHGHLRESVCVCVFFFWNRPPTRSPTLSVLPHTSILALIPPYYQRGLSIANPWGLCSKTHCTF